MHTDAQRNQLFEELGEIFSSPSRDLLMELLPPVGWADVARQSDITALRGEMAELRGDLRGEMAEVRGEMAELRSDLRGEIAELRGDIAAMYPKLVATNIASMIGVATLVIGAIQVG